MKLRNLRLSLRALAAHRTRALLALASVATGVAAVLVTSAIGSGAEDEIARRMDTIGTNLLIVRPAQVERSVSRRTIRGFVTTLTYDDYEAIATRPLIAAAAPNVDRPVRVKAGPIATLTNVRGTTPAYLTIRSFRLQAGQLFAEDENRRVAILGARVADSLFPDSDPLGREIRVRGVPFEVIGVLEAKGVSTDGSDEDNQVVVPIRTAMRRVFNTDWLTGIFLRVTDAARMDDAREDVAAFLRTRHGGEDFGIQNTARLLSMQRELADSLNLFATALGALALVVGGTGILALMLLSVRERTSEIGLRLAVGARPRDILTQFLAEATMLAVGGWVTGVVLGSLAAVVVDFATDWKLALPREALAASAMMVAITGLGFGAYPARTASRMIPIEAMMTT